MNESASATNIEKFVEQIVEYMGVIFKDDFKNNPVKGFMSVEKMKRWIENE